MKLHRSGINNTAFRIFMEYEGTPTGVEPLKSRKTRDYYRLEKAILFLSLFPPGGSFCDTV